MDVQLIAGAHIRQVAARRPIWGLAREVADRLRSEAGRLPDDEGLETATFLADLLAFTVADLARDGRVDVGKVGPPWDVG